MDLKEKLKEASFVTYVCNRFLTLGSFDSVALELGVPADSFDKLFSETPELEDAINDKIDEISEKRLRRTAAAGAVAALTTLNDKLIDIEDDRSTVSACSAILTYQARQFPNKDKNDDKDDIDKMFEDLRR